MFENDEDIGTNTKYLTKGVYEKKNYKKYIGRNKKTLVGGSGAIYLKWHVASLRFTLSNEEMACLLFDMVVHLPQQEL